MRKGFSLVELSIVLVILGLLVGGILAGKSLIRASELRAVVSEYDKYKTSAFAFRDKYLAIPGDMVNATSFWPKADTGLADGTQCATPNTDNAVAGGTCNGNGSGTVIQYSSAGSSNEVFRFWQHLQLAGLLEGTYTGVGNGAYNVTLIGSNIPRSKISSAGWGAATHDQSGGVSAVSYNINYGNIFYYGTQRPSGMNADPVISPAEAWNLDTKMDDGRPGYGNFIVIEVANCTTGSDNTNRDVEYDLTLSDILCTMRISKAF